jgi:transcriptional regulator GlxA family with amidase domain
VRCTGYERWRVRMRGTYRQHLLAVQVGLPRQTAERLFKLRTGRRLREFAISERLKVAKDLIEEGVKVESALLSAGFRSKATFYRHYKATFGRLPKRRVKTR